VPDDDEDEIFVAPRPERTFEMTRDVVVEVDGDRYATIDYGGTGPDILLIHQLASNAQVWAPVAPDLAGIGHVVAVDLRAHGLSHLPVDRPERLVADAVGIARELGLDRPYLLVEQDEMLALDPDRMAAFDAPALGMLAMASVRRGEEARTEWAEQVGPETLDVWDERFGLFATGTADELEPYLERIVARAHGDWVAHRIGVDQYRDFYRRQIETTPEGWRRLPGRQAMDDIVGFIETQPQGLDLLDTYDGPVWILASDEATTDVEIETLREYTAGRDDREIRVVPGGPKVEALDGEALAAAVAEMIRRHPA